MPAPVLARRVADVRRFNRFYTQRIGVLDKAYLHSEFSLAEGRVLYELAHRDTATATELVVALGVDGGYVSRILSGFVRYGLVKRTRSAHDRRQTHLTLTRAGSKALSPLQRRAHDEVAAMLAPLGDPEQRRLVDAMQEIQTILGSPDRAEHAAQPYLLRMHQPGDMGWIVHRQAVLYHDEYGWNEEYEALIADILSRFVRRYDPRRERCWIAERGGGIVGSVFVVARSKHIAQLRMLYVEPSARGLGIGRRLVDECVRFARARGYRTLMLWTNDVLDSARRIYEAVGFRLVSEKKHHSFGHDLVGQNWELTL
jgi:DNA-binding MarR family transcriptional regulator/GNAT superfamily N-acetyltransferase